MNIKYKNIYKKIVKILANSSTCNKLKVGCLILRDDRIVASGYGGSLPGKNHCTEKGHIMLNNHCIRTIHAEQNALLFCAKQGISTYNCEMVISHFPCLLCTKLCIAAGIKKIYYITDYKNKDNIFAKYIEIEKLK